VCQIAIVTLPTTNQNKCQSTEVIKKSPKLPFSITDADAHLLSNKTQKLLRNLPHKTRKRKGPHDLVICLHSRLNATSSFQQENNQRYTNTIRRFQKLKYTTYIDKSGFRYSDAIGRASLRECAFRFRFQAVAV
jgi:hypothetical protein